MDEEIIVRQWSFRKKMSDLFSFIGGGVGVFILWLLVRSHEIMAGHKFSFQCLRKGHEAQYRNLGKLINHPFLYEF